MKHILLCLIVVFFTSGCGKSQKDIAGVYETKEIKEPIDSYKHRSKKWILDLSESGNFTLTKEVFLVPTQDKKYSPIPEKGVSISGEWSLADNMISLKWETFRDLHSEEKDLKSQFGDPVIGIKINSSLPSEVQSNGDLIMGELLLTKYKKTDLEPHRFDAYLQPAYEVGKLRFTKTN